MMNLSRRELFRWITASAAGVALSESMHGLSTALAAQESPPSIVWLNDGGSDLTLLSLLANHVPNFLELVTTRWDVHDHGALMPTGHNRDRPKPGSAPVIVIERLPSPDALAAAAQQGDSAKATSLNRLLDQARVVIVVGTEACYGGLGTDPAHAVRFAELCRASRTPLIKLPGVPTPPHHLVGVLAYLDFFGFPRMDAHARPLLYYDRTVCDGCERRADLEHGRYAERFGQQGCLLRLGCKGPITHNTCSVNRWNQGTNWCVGAGGPCTGCSEPGYPDHGGVGLYGPLSGHHPGAVPSIWGRMEQIGYGMLGLAGAGFLLQAVRRMAFPPGRETPPSGAGATPRVRNGDTTRSEVH